MTRPAPARPAPPSMTRIGLWGPPGSGKTTFLAALKIATMRRQKPEINWIMNGSTDAASAFLNRSTDELAEQRIFPSATDSPQGLMFRFTGEDATVRRNVFGRRQTGPERVAFELDLLDVPGRLFDGQTKAPAFGELESGDEFRLGGGIATEETTADVQVEWEDRLLDHLQYCQGIIYLFDPVRDAQKGDAFRFFHSVLEKLTRRVFEQDHYDGARLPHHVAVCVTKFDQPEIYTMARRHGYAMQDDTPPFLPRVDSSRAADFFKRLCFDSPSGNADLVEGAIRQYFTQDRVGYFITSAIGFFVRENNRFQPQDCLNVTGPPDRIRGKVFPIDVLEAVLWLQHSIRMAG